MAQPDVARRPATYEDLLEVPDHLVAEILDRKLHTTPRPAPRHAHATSVLGVEIGGPFHIGRGGPGGWWILDEPELHLNADIAVPDLAGWRRSRLLALPTEAYFTLAPDWVCEVVSPGTAAMDRTTKLAIYANEGIAHAWLVDPLVRRLEVLRLENGRWSIVSTGAAGDVVRAELFREIELDLSLLWDEPA
jgi:Uma2 family endonuclease